MYPHVVQFETRREELKCELQLIRERKQARASSQRSATRIERNLRGGLAIRASRNLELEPELTIERT